MRIIVFTKRDLAGALVLNQLMPHIAGDQVLVLLSDKTRPAEKSLPELSEIKFLERDLPIDTVFPLVDMAGGGEAELATFDGIAARYGVPIKTIADVNGEDELRLMRDFAPDLMLSIRFSLIFKRPAYSLPPLGTWNIHPGALPRYAGLFAPFRAMLDGADAIGCTLHKIDDGIDTGPVVGIGRLPIDPEHSLLWHVMRAYAPGIDLFVDMLEGVRAGRPPLLQIQDWSEREYLSMPGAEQFEAFRAKGLRLYEPKDYLALLQRFMPPGLALPNALAEPREVGASCCCARA